MALDVTDRASIAKAFDAAEAALGPVTILVNNAGVPAGSYFLKMSDSDWRSVMDVNLDGVFRVGQEAARRMSEKRTGGSIINIASITAFGVLKGIAPYSASKAAVVSLTKSMALELARDDIRVNALAPATSQPNSTMHSSAAMPASGCCRACRWRVRASSKSSMARCCCWRPMPAPS